MIQPPTHNLLPITHHSQRITVLHMIRSCGPVTSFTIEHHITDRTFAWLVSAWLLWIAQHHKPHFKFLCKSADLKFCWIVFLRNIYVTCEVRSLTSYMSTGEYQQHYTKNMAAENSWLLLGETGIGYESNILPSDVG